MRRTIYLASLAMLVTAGCAKNPDAIAAISMPVNAYSGLTCGQLESEFQRSNSALQSRSAEQRSAATGDAVGVFLIGVPMSSLTGGDKEGLIAQHKGEVLAIQASQRQNGCQASIAPSASQASAPRTQSPSVRTR